MEKSTNESSFVDYSPESWKINPSLLSPRARELWAQENEAPIVVAEDNSLRPKILDACGMTCTFCHNEGTPVVSELMAQRSGQRSLGRVSIYAESNGVSFVPGRMHADGKLQSALLRLNAAVGVSELHLTGGEPSLHPELPDIIRMGKNLGMKIKMTSNGENPKAFQRCAEAGLDRVIFSVFGTNAAELSQVQHAKYQNAALAQRKIDSLHRSINVSGENGIAAAANVVVPGPGHEQRVISIIDRFDNLSLRLLNSLDDGDSSFVAIYELLAQMNAKPAETKLSAGSSNTRTNYVLPNGPEISFKQIRPARLEHVCQDCKIDAAGKCEEGFYGLRLYVDDAGDYLVGVCIQRMDLTMHLDEFLDSPLPEQIREFRQKEKRQMEQFVSLTSNNAIQGGGHG